MQLGCNESVHVTICLAKYLLHLSHTWIKFVSEFGSNFINIGQHLANIWNIGSTLATYILTKLIQQASYIEQAEILIKQETLNKQEILEN